MKTTLLVLLTLTFAANAKTSGAPANAPNLSPLPFHEVLSSSIGPGPSYSSAPPNMNVNHSFDQSKLAGRPVPDCQRLAAQPGICPSHMVFVCSKNFRTAICMDRFMMNDPQTGIPIGNMNEQDCRTRCAAQNERLPTNNEWLVSCTGTVASQCLPPANKIYWPAGKYAHTVGHPCYGADVNGPSQACLEWPGFIAETPPVKPTCTSEAGVYGCVGYLEQWVSTRPSPSRGRFNGGFYGHAGSSVWYTTTGHSPDFRHFGSTCRCAKDISAE